MENYVMPILLAIIGVIGSVFGFVQFLITRKDKKKNNNIEVLKAINDINLKLNATDEKLKAQEQSQTRIEMLVMMNHYKNDINEIMRLAEHYFKNGGDFYMTSLFAKWLKENNLPKPLWFDESK